jgi:hypothetical protein
MSGFATASTGTFTTSDGCSIVYTLCAASLSGVDRHHRMVRPDRAKGLAGEGRDGGHQRLSDSIGIPGDTLGQ